MNWDAYTIPPSAWCQVLHPNSMDLWRKSFLHGLPPENVDMKKPEVFALRAENSVFDSVNSAQWAVPKSH
jgi:hypothetical protein